MLCAFHPTPSPPTPSSKSAPTHVARQLISARSAPAKGPAGGGRRPPEAARGGGGRPPPKAARGRRIALRALRGGARGGRRLVTSNAGGYRRPQDLFKPLNMEGISVLHSDVARRGAQAAGAAAGGCRRPPEAARRRPGGSSALSRNRQLRSWCGGEPS